MPITFTSVRHAESESNLAHQFFEQGRRFPNEDALMRTHTSRRRLTPAGRLQVEVAREWLLNWMREEGLEERDFRYYVSPYVRTMETAGLLGVGEEWRKDSRLMERNWGEFDQMTYEERERLFANEMSKRKDFAFFWRPSNGETMQEMLIRRYLMFATYRRECSAGHCIQVAHGEVMTVDRYLLEYWTPEDLRAYMQGHPENVHIHNCRIIQYTRIREDGTLSAKIARVRFVNPMAPCDQATNLDWQSVMRPLFTHKELLTEAESYPHYFEEPAEV